MSKTHGNIPVVSGYLDASSRATDAFMGGHPENYSSIERIASTVIGYTVGGPLLTMMEAVTPLVSGLIPDSHPYLGGTPPKQKPQENLEVKVMPKPKARTRKQNKPKRTTQKARVNNQPITSRLPRRSQTTKQKPRQGQRKMPPLTGKVLTPPTSYQSSYNASPYLNFTTGSNPGSLRMTMRQKLCTVQIRYDGSGNPTAHLVGGTAGTSDSVGTLAMCPANSYYMSDPIFSFAKLFTKWRQQDLCFEYVPRCSTQDGNALTWGWTEDGSYGDSHGWSGGAGGYTPTESQVGMLPGATQFPAYVSMQCLRIRGGSKWLYSTAADFTGAINSSTDIVSDIRNQYSGVLCMSASDNSVGTINTTVVKGAIFVVGTFDFHELAAAITTDPSLMNHKPIISHFRERKTKREQLPDQSETDQVGQLDSLVDEKRTIPYKQTVLRSPSPLKSLQPRS